MCTSYVRISMLIWMPRIEPRIGQIIPRRTSSIWYSFCKNSWLWAENVFFWLGNMFFGIIANRNELVPPKNQLFKKPTFQPKTYFRPENQNSNKNCSRHSSSPNGDPARPFSAKFSTNTRTASTYSSHYSSVAATSLQNHFHATPKRILTSKRWKKTSTF